MEDNRRAVEFMITIEDPGILVRWLEPFGKPNQGMYKVLKEMLEEIDGVEEVTMLRYTAILLIADHVLSAETLAANVFAALTEDPEFRFAVTFQLNRPTDVKMGGRVVRL